MAPFGIEAARRATPVRALTAIFGIDPLMVVVARLPVGAEAFHRITTCDMHMVYQWSARCEPLST